MMYVCNVCVFVQPICSIITCIFFLTALFHCMFKHVKKKKKKLTCVCVPEPKKKISYLKRTIFFLSWYYTVHPIFFSIGPMFHFCFDIKMSWGGCQINLSLLLGDGVIVRFFFQIKVMTYFRENTFRILFYFYK